MNDDEESQLETQNDDIIDGEAIEVSTTVSDYLDEISPDDLADVEGFDNDTLNEERDRADIIDSPTGGEPRPESGALVRYDPLESYMSEIRHIPRLSKEEEMELAIRYKEKNDQVAGYRLVMANLRLVVHIAREYRRNLRNILDLIQEGNLGLLQAVKQFDPFKGVRFPSYAAYWIRAYMLRYLINNIRLVKVGTTQAQRRLFFNLQKEKARLEAEGFFPEARLLAQRLEVKESEVLEMEQRLALPDLSVDAPVGGPEEEKGDYHSIIADSQENAEDRFADRQFSEKVREAVDEFSSKLPPKEKEILERRLFSDEPETLQDLATRFDLSRERIRQLENRIRQQLRDFLSEKLGLSKDGEISFS